MSTTNTKFTILYKIRNYFTDTNIKKSTLLIGILGIIVFSNGLFNDFVGDDNTQILENPAIQSVKNIPSFFSGSTFYIGKDYSVGVFYKPIMQTTYSLIYAFSGENAFGFHFIQIALHIINSFLLYLLLRHFLKPKISLILSLVFLVHPINSESVFYIAAMQENLFFLFGISALLILINAKDNKKMSLVGLFLLLALFSKESGILFVFSCLLYMLVFKRKKLFKSLPYILTSIIIYLPIKIIAVGLIPSPTSTQIALLPLYQRLINFPEIMFFYIKQFFFPIELAYAYRWVYTSLSYRHFLIPLLFDILFAVILMYIFRLLQRNNQKMAKAFIFFCGIFLSGIILHSQIIPLDLTVSERWFYFPIVGLLGLIGILLQNYKVNLNSKWLNAIVIILILLLSFRTIVRSFDWRDQLTLSLKDNKIENQDYTANNYIANELLKEEKLDEALEYTKASIKMHPYFTNYNTLGLIYLNQEEYQKAKEAFIEGMKYGQYSALYTNIGILSTMYGSPEEYIPILEDSVRIFPNNANFWTFLATAQYRSNNRIDAIRSITIALGLDNNNQNIQRVHTIIMNKQELKIKTNTIPK